MKGYGKGVVVESGYRLLHPSEEIRKGDRALAFLEEGEWFECVDTVGLVVGDTPFIAVERLQEGAQ